MVQAAPTVLQVCTGLYWTVVSSSGAVGATLTVVGAMLIAILGVWVRHREYQHDRIVMSETFLEIELHNRTAYNDKLPNHTVKLVLRVMPYVGRQADRCGCGSP